MRLYVQVVLSAAMALCSLAVLKAQDLSPRAYVITPLHSNAITVTYSFYDGNINYNGALPVTGATGTYNVPIFSVYHSFSFFGRSANFVASLPYAVGNSKPQRSMRRIPGRVHVSSPKLVADACITPHCAEV